MVVHTHTQTRPWSSQVGGEHGHRQRKKWPRAAVPHQMSYAGAPDIPEARANGKWRRVSRPRALYLPDGGRQPNTFNCMRREGSTSSRPELTLAARSLLLTGSAQDDSLHYPFQCLCLLLDPHCYSFQQNKKERKTGCMVSFQMFSVSPERDG